MGNFKFILIFILLWAIPIESISQDYTIQNTSSGYLNAWSDLMPQGHPQASQHFFGELDQFVLRLRDKRYRYKDQERFLEYVYYKVHQKYLRGYQSPSTLSDLIARKKYDCITGTALYGIILEKLGFDYTITETTYHVYLTLTVDNKLVLMESTDPLNGYMVDTEMIRAKIDSYNQDQGGEAWNNRDYYRPFHQVSNEIDLIKLAGLQYFNQAAAAYNEHDLKQALRHLSMALELYPCARLQEMMVVMLNTLEHDQQIDPMFKQEFMSKYGHLRHSVITAQLEK